MSSEYEPSISSFVTLSSSQLKTSFAVWSSFSALALILLEYFKDHMPIAINPINNTPSTIFMNINDDESLVMNFIIPTSFKIISMIPIPPHIKNVIAEERLSLYLSVLFSYRLPPVRRELSSGVSSTILSVFSGMIFLLVMLYIISSCIISYNCEKRKNNRGVYGKKCNNDI